MDTRCLPPNLQDGNLGREPYLRGSAGPPVKEEGFRVTGVGAPISGRRQAEGPALAPVFEGQGWLPGTIFPTEVYEAKGPRPEWRAGKSKTPRGHRLLRLRGERSCPLRNPARPRAGPASNCSGFLIGPEGRKRRDLGARSAPARDVSSVWRLISWPSRTWDSVPASSR